MAEDEELTYLEECICNRDCFDVQTWKTFVTGRWKPCLENNQEYNAKKKAALERKNQPIEVITLDDDDTTVGEPAFDPYLENYGEPIMDPNMEHFTKHSTEHYTELTTREPNVIDVITISDED